jgi:predicted Fe-S protein YdhL (DUF1289 family)
MSTYKFKTRKTIELLGQSFEEFAASFPPESTIVAVLHAWNDQKSKLSNGIIKEVSRKSAPNDYQLFGKWLKHNNDSYRAMSMTEFNQLHSSLWKQSAELDEWKAFTEEEKSEIVQLLSQKVSQKNSQKKMKDVIKDEKKDEKKDTEHDDSVKPKKSKKSSDTSDKPSDKPKKSKKSKKDAPSDKPSDVLDESDFE